MESSGLGGQFALDLQGFERLRNQARRQNGEGLEQAAEQFEAQFLQMMLKSMREAIPRSELMESQQVRFHESLMDQQWAQHLAGRGIGLAEQLVAQLRDDALDGPGPANPAVRNPADRPHEDQDSAAAVDNTGNDPIIRQE